MQADQPERAPAKWGMSAEAKKQARGRIDSYYLSRHCAVCDALTRQSEPLCQRCASDPQSAAVSLVGRVREIEDSYERCVRVCLACGGGGGPPEHRGVACVVSILECVVSMNGPLGSSSPPVVSGVAADVSARFSLVSTELCVRFAC